MDILDVTQAREIIENFNIARVMVIGDLILDRFIWGKVERISPEAPVPVVEVTSESMRPGGAANVANNIASLGGRVLIGGVIGSDLAGGELVSLLRAKGIEANGIFQDGSRPTSVKTRIIAHSQQVVRFDRERKDGIEGEVRNRLLGWIEEEIGEVDGVVISDYAKGVVSKELVEKVVDLARRWGKKVVVDPKVKHFSFYKGVTIITPNTMEASKASGVEITDEESLERAGRTLLAQAESEAILITRGEHGMTLFEAGKETLHIPTVAKEVYDVTGAGDTVVATCALALASGADFRSAAILSNYAAGIVVGEVGTATVTKDELLATVENGEVIREADR